MKKFFQHKVTLLFALLLLPVILFGLVFAADYKNVSAVPGNPGNPEAPTVIFNEDFENNSSSSPIGLSSYTGSTGMTYTANPAWRTNCNGEVLYFNMLDNQFANSNCSVGNGGPNSGTNLTTAYDAVRRLAYALGQLNNTSSPGANRALTAYTDAGNVYIDPGANLVQFETANPINLPSGSRRFVISNLDNAAINCTNPGTVTSKLAFYLVDGSNVRRINQTAIDVCNDAGYSTFTPPPKDSNGALGPSTGSIRAKKIITDRALLSDTSSIRLRMINEEGGGQGNDNAIDNIQISDASPKLDKSFSPDSVMVNEISRMTFTVTNTTDLLAKEGWSFTDNLPENLVVAENPNIETDCPSGAVVAQPGDSSVEYSGNLSQGMTSCTLHIDVTSSEAGTYVNGPANLVDVVGLHLPADAEVTFAPLAPDTGDKNAHLPLMYAGAGIAVIGFGTVLRRKFQTKKR